jgi:TorA maturation chaperone TorD
MKRMTSEEKEIFVASAVRLLSPPDSELLSDILEGRIHPAFHVCLEALHKDIDISTSPEILMENVLPVLAAEYDRLFSGLGRNPIPLVESVYKPWTTDSTYRVPFARSPGLLMGDSALHMAALYRHCGLEVPEAFSSSPDHLLLELEFLGILYRAGRPDEIKTYREDHLDWISQIRGTLDRDGGHLFYLRVFELLEAFLEREKEGSESEKDG